MSKVNLLLCVTLAVVSEIFGQGCNVCDLTTGFACFSQNQYFFCDATGINTNSLQGCVTGVCDSTIASDPCSLTSAPTCPSPPVPTQATPTTTEATTTTTTTTAATTTVAYKASTFCSSKSVGRYANPTDTTCTKYVYCYLNGGIQGADYTCVGSTLFDPSVGQCVTNFACSGTTVTSTPASTTTTITSTPTSTTTTTPTTTTPTTTTTTTTTPSTTTTSTTTAPIFDATSFCSSKSVARYSYPAATNCTKYIYCYLNSGMKGAVYTCPGATFFNPSLGACESGYVCV